MVPTKMTPITTSITQHTMFRKDYYHRSWKIPPIKPFLKDSFIKFGTSSAYSEMLLTFVNFIPENVNSITKNLLIHGFSGAKKLFLIIMKNNFVALG